MRIDPSGGRFLCGRRREGAAAAVLVGLLGSAAAPAGAALAHRVRDINVDSEYAAWGGICSDVDVRVAAEHAGYVLADATGAGCGLYRVAADASGLVPIAPPREFGARAGEVFGRSGSLVFYAASTAATGLELWRSDGTAAGTFLLDDTTAGPGGFGWSFWFEAAEPTSYFVRTGRATGVELWATDGTPGGTRLVRDIRPGGESGVRHEERQAWDGLLFFVADDGVAGPEVWRTDGTAAGTWSLTDLPWQSGDEAGVQFAALPSAVLIQSLQSGWGPALWRSDGTVAGTSVIWTGNPNYWGHYPLSVVGDRVMFAERSESNWRVWTTDATSAGTQLVIELPAAPDEWYWGFFPAGDLALFFAADAAHGLEPWVTDGTSAGTHLLLDVWPGPEGSLEPYADNRFAILGDLLLMRLDDGVHGRELWASDGTPAGTVLVADLAPGPEKSEIGSFQGALGGAELFTLTLPSAPTQLWRTDGTPGGTAPVTQLGGPLTPSFPWSMTATGELAYFLAREDGSEAWPWRTDGSEEGTLPLAGDLQEFYAERTDFVALDDGTAIANTGGNESSLIWSSSGDDIQPLREVSYFCSGHHTCGLGHAPPSVGPVALFGEWSEGFGSELWATDGTVAGTGLWLDVLPGPESSLSRTIIDVGGEIWFSALDADVVEQVWRTHETPASAVPFAVLGPVPSYDLIKTLWPVDVPKGRFYFLRETFDGDELWFVDEAGSDPSLVRAGLDFPALLGVAGTKLLFVSEDLEWVGSAAGRELWVSDGTAEGTRVLRDIWSGPIGSQIKAGVELGGSVFFSACEPTAGCELWRSDGTAAGTARFLDLEAGPASSAPLGLSRIDERIYLSGCTLASGCEIWVTDGSPGGTHRLGEIAPGPYSSLPQYSPWPGFVGPRFERSGDLIYFGADDGTGAELWAMPIELFYDGFETGDVNRWDKVVVP